MKEAYQKFQQYLLAARTLKYDFARKALRQKLIQHPTNGLQMRFDYFIHGQKPQNGYRLVFGLHGGGGCPFQVNQQQWNNHKHLYDEFLPTGTIWLVPRSAQEAPDMWWKDYVPDLFTIIIDCFKALNMIDPNRVFITGYSAGGDGIYHLAAMMADLVAGAAMMAGHPNKADVYNLRNIVFSIQVGRQDHAYDRANWGKVYMNKVMELQKQYGGFKQYSQIHSSHGHWMEKNDALIFPDFLNEVRNPYPEFIFFRQHPRTFKKSFYYLKLEEKHEGLICVRRKNNFFEIESEMQIPIKVMVNCRFIDFSKEVKVKYNGAETVLIPQRSEDAIRETALESIDPWYVFECEIWCVPGTNLPKRPMRPFELENMESSLEKIKQIENGVKEDENLHVKFVIPKNKLVDQIVETEKMHQESKDLKKEKLLKKLEDSFEWCCEIY